MLHSQTNTLAQLQPGQKARIHSFSDVFLSGKLMEMGCLPGSEVQMEQIAPMGDPIIISIAGSFLSLRKEEAATVAIIEIVAE